ncbi:MAG: hypothetical protein IJJ76_12225 [Ruminococcus sp.]|uniref:hypothetical protein n=1 Tax=Ruminococcus sp. TaxID=41978 RepID=UPI0025FBB007|nr:hypothetical protein [Ruminococcus sp.]MBQ9542654.1 hypothetical protein [Ruminococcus sp.]MBR0530514.1 hypothetical protein [Ruminococcus sp.]
MTYNISDFIKKAENIKPKMVRQDIEEIIFNGRLTEEVMSNISAEMTKAEIPYKFGHSVSLGEDFSGFAPRKGRVYIHATHFGNYGKSSPFITWGFVEERWLTR